MATKKTAKRRAAIRGTSRAAARSALTPAELRAGVLAHIQMLLKFGIEKKKAELWIDTEGGVVKPGKKPGGRIIIEKKKVEREVPPGTLIPAAAKLAKELLTKFGR